MEVVSMNPHKPSKLTFAAVLLLGLCSCSEMQSTVQTTVENRTVRNQQPSDKAVQADVQAVDSPSDSLSGCDETLLDKSVKDGRFLVAQCQTRTGYELRFVRIVDDHADVVAHSLDDATAGAIVESTATLWDSDLVSVNLAQERGGELIIGNWRAGNVVFSQVPYMTKDEETLGLDYRDRTFFISTQAKSERRLVEVSAGGDAGKFKAETHTCTVDAGSGKVQTVVLSVDAQDRAIGVTYVGVTPQLNGTTTSCTLEADRDDADVLWTDIGRETLVDLGPHFDGGGNDRIRISSAGGTYSLGFDVRPSRHCGHSSVLAREITLEVGRTVCTSVVLSD